MRQDTRRYALAAALLIVLPLPAREAGAATPSAHSPPMPRAARKRSPAICQGATAKAHRPENSE